MVSRYTQLLAKRYAWKLDSDAHEFITCAVEGTMPMQQLIQDLLAYSRVSTGGRQFEPVAVGIALDSAPDNLINAVKESRAVITHDPLPAVMADERQLVQPFQNLLSNAVKFNGEQPPRIHVSAERRAGEWVFSIRDEEPGRSRQSLNH
ncbi:MAG: Phytochrome, two-component sensor histidine kinase [Nitrospira sp.]|jgi:light-regulated signal transduction histidine kinase (bacteriophytochrome)|nr:MAG: Phytochrome, two-component sensor histidine kinase [Nitrospira sp.]